MLIRFKIIKRKIKEYKLQMVTGLLIRQKTLVISL